jgi:hypothetical protein
MHCELSDHGLIAAPGQSIHGQDSQRQVRVRLTARMQLIGICVQVDDLLHQILLLPVAGYLDTRTKHLL